jgi:hypothetical protein
MATPVGLKEYLLFSELRSRTGWKRGIDLKDRFLTAPAPGDHHD